MSTTEPVTHAIQSGGSIGPSVDRTGAPVIDPTKNVQDLVEAAIRRINDIQVLSITHLREVQKISDENLRHTIELQAAHQREKDTMRILYEDKLREAESKRIDAIRAVDVGNVQRASEFAAVQASTLATQVTASAEALRGQVAAAAGAASGALTTALAPIQEAVESLRQAQYQQQGERTSKTEDRGANQWQIGLLVSAIISVISIGIGVAIAVLK